MDFKEFIKTFVAEDKLEELLKGMKDNKFYLASEENLDTRYAKLKGDYDALTNTSNADKQLISELKKSSKGNEEMQSKFNEHEATIAQLQAENEQLKIDNEIKVELLAQKAKPSDLDYLIFKIKQEHTDIKLDEQGKLKGINVADVKQVYPSNFETSSKKEVDVNNLPNINNKDVSVSKEQFDKMGYSSRVKLKEENPEMYNALTKK